MNQFHYQIIRATQEFSTGWDNYVLDHPQSTYCHLFGWKPVFEQTYRLPTYYLFALNNDNTSKAPNQSLCGVLPLVHLQSRLFGNSLVSLPFLDLGGPLSYDSEENEHLVASALDIAKQLEAKFIDLRRLGHRTIETDNDFPSRSNGADSPSLSAPEKARMLLPVPPTSQELWTSFKSKLRSQIKRPMKDGLASRVGGVELLDDFYGVFARNMRDLGSPVHAKSLFSNVLSTFSNHARLVLVYQGHRPLACSLIFGFKNILENPWSSALKEYSHLSPNMLLYWSMLEYACDHGFKYFDFGRSTPGEGTYRFKTQWGAQPYPLNWEILPIHNDNNIKAHNVSTTYKWATEVWKRLPVPVTILIGPRIRKYISL